MIVPAIIFTPAKSPARSTNGNQSSAHTGANLVASVAVDDDLAAGNAACLAAVGTADHVTGVAVYDDPTATHVGRDPVAGAAVNVDLPAADTRA